MNSGRTHLSGNSPPFCPTMRVPVRPLGVVYRWKREGDAGPQEPVFFATCLGNIFKLLCPQVLGLFQFWVAKIQLLTTYAFWEDHPRRSYQKNHPSDDRIHMLISKVGGLVTIWLTEDGWCNTTSRRLLKETVRMIKQAMATLRTDPNWALGFPWWQ